MSWDPEELEQLETGMVFVAVVNHEEQYSIWPADRDLPDGWRPAGKTGTKQECLDFIEAVWTDMRPLSLRQHMDRS
jgi:MbtH protein